jgi:hypothetical protein
MALGYSTTFCSWQNTNAQIRLAILGGTKFSNFFNTDAVDQSTQTTALAASMEESDTMISSSLARCVSQALCAVTPSECQDCASSKRRSSLDSIMTACKPMHILAATQAGRKCSHQPRCDEEVHSAPSRGRQTSSPWRVPFLCKEQLPSLAPLSWTREHMHGRHSNCEHETYTTRSAPLPCGRRT